METPDLSKHTPGPWTAQYSKPGNHWKIMNKEGQFTMFVAETYGFDSDEQDEANAELIALAPTLLEQNKKLQDFKEYVHKRLDEAGIEKNPNGEHSKQGCRIGDRLDIVLEQNKKMREALEKTHEFLKHENSCYFNNQSSEEGILFKIITEALK